MQKGNIGVTTNDIFPIIKKFLYSDHEIFLREIVSNAVDATQKLKTLASVGEYKGEIGDLKVEVKADSKAGTLTISDRGIGMTQEEIDKYINRIAFSGAEDFLEKYKNDANAIIGHFGLGFYSSFMVSKKVEIITKSYKEGSKAVKWSCDGSPEYTFEDVEKADRGTDIVLYIDDENKDFLEEHKINELLTKYCKFLPIPITFGKKKDWKDGKEVETDQDNVINNTQPAWTRKPVDLKPEDYKSFYHELYPYSEDPLFYIHLNVDYPFNLTGILYFPKLKNNFEIQKNKIQLYCNQVYVTDSVEGIVPEFLTLLHGVIDSPDIPLNVSRSYLQSDSNVKKISNHITKKVADRLEEIFKTQRSELESKWDDLKIFIEYGMLSDDKFNERAEKFVLLKNADDKYFTIDEYEKLISENQKDKDGKVVYLYATNTEDQHQYIQAAKDKDKGYDVLIMDGTLDIHFISKLEQKMEGKARFTRVDADVIDKLIQKGNEKMVTLTTDQQNALTSIFSSKLPNDSKMNFIVTYENLDANSLPVYITQNEFMRRMKEMSATGGGMGFYGNMPDSYNLVVNTAHPLIEKILKDEEAQCGEKVNPLTSSVAELEKKRTDLKGDKKESDLAEAIKDEVKDLDNKINDAKNQQKEILAGYAKDSKEVSQLVDLALLSNNLLKGEALSNFIKRSMSML
ncbi:MAG TPA: molecular chaperone HtpG [Paludibacteraceae bacterium]|nr:molecular chaperone HtpG [Paludibacteraceae bacterium]HOU69171.1 molecular chaperone HtpG [Paludibacteraceae bacterium]HPH63277.1 molecular chaperone HtpG [Paludibacteraceae bacterium]HQF50960.1 molecular chaperone HtpG [Paludibacteraceae bacterium]